ncbi:MAG TPA: secretin N-terminal domain-containing protein [Pyrinomonadaceae bacterium]|jgi:general secretion pathway protein D|nr:secretin N-terminal domain-containing protein [Pyrinomonadaceae bacterium]
MKIPAFFRNLTALLMIFCLLSASIVAAGYGKGDKEFKQGMKHETAQEWDLAAEQFALAVVANPKNAEFRLHLQRAMFNASQMFVQKGNALVEEKDYVGAYNNFRKAYSYDPTNQLARAEMDRMVRLQSEVDGAKPIGTGSLNLMRTSYTRPEDVKPEFVSQRLEEIKTYKFAGASVVEAIKQLCEELGLNVLFDRGSQAFNSTTGQQARTLTINLKDVSAARALDYIFRQEGFFFQKVGPKTIIVASQDRRQFFTELVLRTFYLGNANPEDVAKIVQQAIPVQPGRTQTFVQIDKSTNSLTIRDTEENIRLMEKLIKSLDKDRAEVVMDVNIYEVTRNDLLKLGNQVGGLGSLGDIGGLTGGFATLNQAGANAAVAAVGDGLLNTAMGPFLSIPSSVLSALQSKTNTRLLASTQVHAFNNEESQARIGSRVPVRSAQIFTGSNNTPGNNGNVFGDVFNYEQVGLTLKFTPIVFPNQDVQVKMSIESKDVIGATNDDENLPTFSERSVTGTARVQNNRTLMLASVAQDVANRGKTGIPLLSFIPILGRLFATPIHENRKTDIVIAVTPRVLRAPIVLPEDEELRPTGSVVSPTNGSLEAMIVQEEKDEYLASLRRSNNTASLRAPGTNNAGQPSNQPGGEMPGYVPANTGAANTGGTAANTVKAADTNNTPAVEAVSANTEPKTDNASVTSVTSPAVNLKPIETNVRTLDIGKTLTAVSDQGNKPVEMRRTSLSVEPVVQTAPQAEFSFGAVLPEMAKGTKITVPVLVKSAADFRLAILALKYDEQKLAIRSITYGDIFGNPQIRLNAVPYMNKGGKTFVALTSSSVVSESGVLAYIEIEALADGRQELAFDGEAMNMISSAGANFVLSFK